MCIAKAIFEGTFKRQENPKPMDPNGFMAKKLMGPRFPELCESTETHKKLLQSIPHEDVEIKTQDGLTLRGWFYDAGSKNTVILVHGYQSDGYRDNSKHGYTFFQKGFNVLLSDNRSFGTSEGEYTTFGVKEAEDTTEWVKFINKRIPDGKIVLHGTSLGGATVCMASNKEMENVVAIVSDCSFTTVPWEFEMTIKAVLGFAPKFIIKSGLKYAKKVLDIDYYDISPIKCVENSKYPMMFVHGKADLFIPYKSAEELYAVCPTEKDILLIDNCGHTASQLAGDDYYNPIFKFLEKYL